MSTAEKVAEMRFLPSQGEPTAAVIGLGYVGSALAATLAHNGVNTIGVDTDPALIGELDSRYCRFSEEGLPERLFSTLDSGSLRVTTDYRAVELADVVIVSVGTPVGKGGVVADAQLKGACEQLSTHLQPGQLVVFKSTVPPGTTRNVVAPILESSGLVCGEDFGLAFCPERLSEGTALSELGSSPIVVGGWCPHSSEAAEHFWRNAIGTEIIPCASLEAAEVVKLADNWWIDHNIALANELAMLCSKLDVDVLEVIAAANSIPKGNGNVNILLPSVGVGGSCLTKDPWMVWRAAADRGVKLDTIPVARSVNDGMPYHVFDLIKGELTKAGKQLSASKVAVLGLAFKNNTGDLRATPTLPVVTALHDTGAKVTLYDPLVENERLEAAFGAQQEASILDATRDADCVAILAGHNEFHSIDFAELRNNVASTCIILDGRAYYPKETVEHLRSLGFTYRGVGR